MKKSLLSLSAAAVLASSLSAATITLYQDTATGALYTQPGEGRVKLGEFVSKDEIGKLARKDVKKELGVKVKSGVPTLKFSGTHYLGYVFTDDHTDADDDQSKFETRRNYFQVKGYWNDTDYIRMTLDTHQDGTGDWKVRLKYAYIYLNLEDYIPFTGVEFGQAHRPWIDWEEHHGWLYRSIAKTFVEEAEGAHLTNSADLGINFKTNTDYFSSELGVYNGDGYHGEHQGKHMSYEWRLTGHLFGTGKHHVHPTEDEYLDLSFTGQINDTKGYDWYGLHAVYNQPMFLLAAMYIWADNYTKDTDNDGWSVNGEFRPADKWSILARYDRWSYHQNGENPDRAQLIGGVAYTYNKNVKFIGNVFDIDDTEKGGNDEDETRYMFTTEVHW